MQIDTQDHVTDDLDGALTTPAGERYSPCLRCDEQPGNRYVAEIAARPGRPAERASIIRDALLGGGKPAAVPRVRGSPGHLRPRAGLAAPSGRTDDRTPRLL